jgi:microcompartment protein CcmK/EutM
MILGKVLGPLWSSTQDEGFDGLALKLVQPIDPEGQPHGSSILAADIVSAAPDDFVIVVYEGSSSRMVLERPKSPCEAVIVGIVDRIDMEAS